MTETEKKDKDRSKPQPKPCLPPKLCRQHSATARIYACKTERFLAFCENFAVSLREQRRPFSQHDDSRPKKPLTVNTAQRHKLLKTCWFCAIAFVVFRLNSTDSFWKAVRRPFNSCNYPSASPQRRTETSLEEVDIVPYLFQ